MKSQFYDSTQVKEVRRAIEALGLSVGYEYEKHRLVIENEMSNGLAYLRLPLSFKFEDGVDPQPMHYLMLLVQSGSAAVGVFDGEHCLSHKVFSAYMVRKKQGKSQIKHLKTKGKSRAGSRVRLASTLEFFENINTRLNDHFANYEFDRVALSCSKILIPYLYGSKVPTPFEKKDPRIYRIPKHLHQPNYEVMQGMQRYLQKAELSFEEKAFPELIDLI